MTTAAFHTPETVGLDPVRGGARAADGASLVVKLPKAADMLGLSTKTLHRLRRRGEGPPVVELTPGRYGVLLADLDAWVEARRHAGNGAPAVRRTGQEIGQEEAAVG